MRLNISNALIYAFFANLKFYSYFNCSYAYKFIIYCYSIGEVISIAMTQQKHYSALS